MENIIQDFKEYLTKTKGYANHTVIAYETDIRDFIEFISHFNGGEPLAPDLAKTDTIAFRSYLADRQHRELSQKSTARAMSSLRGFYKFLDRRHGIKNEAIGLISSPKVPRKLSRAIDASDVTEMHAAIRQTNTKDPWVATRDWALVLLLFGCGLRISEALSLSNHDVMGRPDVLRIKGKGNKERLVPVLPAVWDAIDRYFATHPFGKVPNEPLFRSVRGLPMSARMAEKVIENLRNYMQLPDYVTPHALRHTFATALLADGADLRSLQELLGHSSLSATQLYTRVNMADISNIYSNAHPRSNK